jgi:dUTPase
MDDVKIDKGIPLPQKSTRISKAYDLYQKMEVGDSVLIKESERTKLHDAIRVMEGTSKGKLSTRREDNGFRVWRIGRKERL